MRRLLSDFASLAEKEHLIYALQFELSRVDDRTVHERMLQLLVQIEPEIANHVALALGLPAPKAKEVTTKANGRRRKEVSDMRTQGWKNHGQTSKALSMELAYPKDSIKSRKVAVLVADGFDAPSLTDVRTALAAQGALPILIGVRKGVIKGAGGEEMAAPFTIWNCKSTLFDAVYVPGGAASVQKLVLLGDALAFVAEAFKHCKAVCASGEGVEMLRKAIPPEAGVKFAGAGDGTVTDQGVVSSGKGAVAADFIKAIAQHRFWARKADVVPA
jgi:catalase